VSGAVSVCSYQALSENGKTLVVAVEENLTVEQSRPHALGMMHVREKGEGVGGQKKNLLTRLIVI